MSMKTLTEKALEIIRSQVRDNFNGNIMAAARFFGISYNTLYTWLGNENRRPSLKSIEPILEKLNITFNEPDNNVIDYAYIPLVHAKAGAGSSLITEGNVDGYYAFRKDFLAQQAIYERTSVLLKVRGNSMEPTLKDGDIILVDKNEPVIVIDGAIYLVTYGDECLVKHIQKTPRGFILRSENPIYADVNIEKQDLEENVFKIHGRVRWFGRTL